MNSRVFEAGKVIEMKTRGNPSGPEVLNISIIGRIYGCNCVS
jgi:hypothetical protein